MVAEGARWIVVIPGLYLNRIDAVDNLYPIWP
jgi:hypothetical protein